MCARMLLKVFKAVAFEGSTGRALVYEFAWMFVRLCDMFAQIVEAATPEAAVGTFVGLLSGMFAHVTIHVTLDQCPELALIAFEPFAVVNQC